MTLCIKSTRRGLLAGIPALAVAMDARRRNCARRASHERGGRSDFAAIEGYRAATALFHADPNDETSGDQWDAYWSLLETAPTTVAGFVAMFTCLAEKDENGQSNLCNAIDYWSGTEPGESQRPHSAEWLAMLADAMRKVAAEAQS